MRTAIRIIVITGLAAALVTAFVASALWRPAEQGAAARGEWTCSMHPQIRQAGPGTCPICGMDLVPVTQLSGEQARLRERAGVETEAVQFRELVKEIRTVGRLDYNERLTAYIAARIAGRVDRVYADFTGVQVKTGDHLVDVYSPDLVVGQGELIRALEARAAAERQGGAELVFAEATLEAARQKLLLLGLLPEQLRDIEKTKVARTHLTIYTHQGGTVVEKSVRPGQYVKEGDVLYRIADFDPLWLYLDVYEYDLAWVRFGQTVQVGVEAYPGEVFEGRVTFIDPFLDDRTRAVKARVNLANPQGKLKPAMYASAAVRVRLLADGSPEPTGLEGKYVCRMHPEVVRDKPGRCDLCEMPLERVPGAPPAPAHPPDHSQMEHKHPAAAAAKADDHSGHGPDCPANATKPAAKPAGGVLAVRASAVLDTGRRQIVYRLTDGGAYELVEVRLGPRAEGKDDAGRKTSYYVVLGGLSAGDRVVVRGGFLLDSQRQIEGMPSLLYPEGQAPAAGHSGHGEPATPKPPPAHKH